MRAIDRRDLPIEGPNSPDASESRRVGIAGPLAAPPLPLIELLRNALAPISAITIAFCCDALRLREQCTMRQRAATTPTKTTGTTQPGKEPVSNNAFSSAGATQRWPAASHSWLLQSKSVRHGLPSLHGGHSPPPQSTPVLHNAKKPNPR